MNSENFREVKLDGFDLTLWKDHYEPNTYYTEEEWQNGKVNSIAKIYNAYITIESLLNSMCQNVASTAIGQNKTEGREKLKEPVIQAMNVLHTALKWRIMEYLWCTKPEIYVNEHIFDLMAPDNVNDVDLRKLIIKDALSRVNIIENENTGRMTIKIDKPQICFGIDAYQQMGGDLVRAYELNTIIVRKIEQDKKEAKEREKAERQSKRKKNE